MPKYKPHCALCPKVPTGGARYPGVLQPGACVILLSKDGLRYVTGLNLRALGTSSAGIQTRNSGQIKDPQQHIFCSDSKSLPIPRSLPPHPVPPPSQ